MTSNIITRRLLTSSLLSARWIVLSLILITGFGRLTNAQVTNQQIHDPVMIKQGDTYYAFGTGPGIPIYSSRDRINWTSVGPVFAKTPDWVLPIAPGFDGNIWAPDIHVYKNVYYLYYSVSAFGRNTSAIALATNTTLDPKDPAYKWIDRGIVVQSVPGKDMWNAIDANLVFDEHETPWLAFGSHWGGIKLVRLDSTLMAVDKKPEWHTIAARNRYWKLDDRDAGDSANPELNYDSLYTKSIVDLNRSSENSSIEAAFIFKKDDYYYLFVSWDRCCRGVNSTYKMVVGRSKTITGPYMDREDEDMAWGGGSLVVRGLHGSKRWAALGHNGTYTFDGKDYVVFHAYDRTDEGKSKLIIAPVEWDRDGWPVVNLDE